MRKAFSARTASPPSPYSGAPEVTCSVCTGGASTATVANTTEVTASAVAASSAGHIGSWRTGALSNARARATSRGSRAESLIDISAASPLARRAAKPMEPA